MEEAESFTVKFISFNLSVSLCQESSSPDFVIQAWTIFRVFQAIKLVEPIKRILHPEHYCTEVFVFGLFCYCSNYVNSYF